MRVVIAGCGYVGCELARQLVEAGHEVTGVRRSSLDTVRQTGARAVRADVTDPDSLDALPDADWLVFSVSPGNRGADAAAARRVYVEGLENVIDRYADSSLDRLVYTSSTGVYGDHGGDWVDESMPIDPQTEKAQVLVDAERTAREAFDGTVVRYTGLYGPDRYRLERYVSGPVTEGYLNMIHRDDAAGIVRFLLETDAARGETIVGVDDEPVDKWELADWLADECGVERPQKRTKAERLAEGDLPPPVHRRLETSKRCRNDRIRALGYEFTYPTYREGYRAAIDAYTAD